MDNIEGLFHGGRQSFLEKTEEPTSREAIENQVLEGLQDKSDTSIYISNTASSASQESDGFTLRSTQLGDSPAVLQRCLYIMSSSLHADICGLIQPGTLLSEIAQSRINDSIPKSLAYACKYWVDHLQKLDKTSQKEVLLRDDGPIHVFLEHSALFWLEVMSLVGMTTEALLKIGKLESMIDPSVHPRLACITRDLKFLIINNRPSIEQAPLQIYVSALLFSPKDFTIRDQCQTLDLSWIIEQPLTERDWSPLLSTLKDSHTTIDCLLFSPTSDLLVYSPRDNIITVWDCLRETKQLEYDVSWLPGSLAFSPSGRFIVSATDFHPPQESPLRILDLITGTVKQFGDSTESIFRAAFSSSSDNHIISVSRKGIIHVWDLNHGEEESIFDVFDLLGLDLSHLWISEVVFSSDGAFLLMIEGERFVIQWDLRLSKVMRTIDLLSRGTVHSVAVSSKGDAVAFAFERDSRQDGSKRRRDIPTYNLELYNLESGLQQAEYQYGFQPISSMVFLSPFSNDIALALQNHGIEIRDTKDFTLRGSYIIPDGCSHIAASTDGRKLAVEGPSGSIHLLDMAALTGSNMADVSDACEFAQFLPYEDDLAIVSSWSETLLWDTTDGTTPTIDMTGVASFQISPHGGLAALTTWHNKTRICNLDTQKELFAKVGRVDHALFSKYSNRLAMATKEESIRIIDTKTLDQVALFNVGRVSALELSPNGQAVAWQTDTDNEKNTVQLWAIGKKKKRLLRMSSYSHPCSITFSRDSHWVAFCGYFKTFTGQKPNVILVEVEKGKKSLIDSEDVVKAFAFHPRGYINATGSDEGHITLRDTKSLSENLTLQVSRDSDAEPGSYRFAGLDISSQGKIVAVSHANSGMSASVQMWDITTGQEIGSYCIDLGALGLQHGFPSVPGRELIRFSEDELLLEYSHGQLPLPSARSKYGESTEKEYNAGTRCLWVSGNWIMQGFERLIMLPTAYQTGIVTVQDDKIIIGRRDGPPVLIKIDLDRTQVSANLKK